MRPSGRTESGNKSVETVVRVCHRTQLGEHFVSSFVLFFYNIFIIQTPKRLTYISKVSRDKTKYIYIYMYTMHQFNLANGMSDAVNIINVSCFLAYIYLIIIYQKYVCFAFCQRQTNSIYIYIAAVFTDRIRFNVFAFTMTLTNNAW